MSPGELKESFVNFMLLKPVMIKKIQNIFWVALAIGSFVSIIYLCVKRYKTDHIAKENMRYIKAVMINERNYNGNTPHEFTGYSYEFNINGTRYTGDSHDTSDRVGDTIKVLYDVNNPALNKPADPNK